MEVIQGIPVSPGVVIGTVFVVDDARRRIPRRTVPAELLSREHERLDEAITSSVSELISLRAETEDQLGPEPAKIFAFHIGMLSDRTLTGPIHSAIDEHMVTAEYAVWSEFQALVRRFSGMGNSAFRTKVDDIWDLEQRVLRQLIGEHMGKLASLDDQAIIIARDLTPSQTAAFDRSKVVAFATDAGGLTSHTAIVARALSIPAVVGLEVLTGTAVDGQTIIVDGDRGRITLDPDDETLERHRGYIQSNRAFRASLDALDQEESVTTDGVHIALLGNIEFPSEIDALLKHGGDGIGLFRTEFLYLTNSDEPTEENHFGAYKACIEKLRGKPLTIRTMDLGSDKQTQGQFEVAERNPALGCRSIRYCLQNLDMFRRQLRAVLRASALGPVKVMFPLVTNTLEIRQARMIVHDVMEDLDEDGIEYDREIPIGMMVEAPSAAVMAATFAKEVDFFSIGTNDLVQYTLAVDRINERVASLYSAAHPAVIRLIKDVVRAARRHEVPVSICGEAAGNTMFTMLLLGLGLRSLSMTPSVIPEVKRVVRGVDITVCERLARKVGSFDSERQITAFMREKTKAIIPEAFDGRSVE